VRDAVPDLPRETVDVLLLLTSELVTNAVIPRSHAARGGRCHHPRSVVVAVHDLDLSRPSQQPYADREGGWGLALVTALAEDHQTQPQPEGGKTAWFRSRAGRSPSWPTATPPAARPAADHVEAEG
jgi:hypothetical protein